MAGIDAKPETNQHSHWNEVFSKTEAFFGEGASEFAKTCLHLFRQDSVYSLLELGAGQGRDTLLFAQGGIDVTALDYSETAVLDICKKGAEAGLSTHISARTHDLRAPLPFADESFDACYSHMLLCMELSTEEVAFILRETHRVLKPDGLVVYSVRSNFDRHYQAGMQLDENTYEIGGFVVHFFSEEKIRNLSKGFEVLKIERMEEGSLPRDLFCVTMKKGPVPESWDITTRKEMKVNDQMGKFQAFMEAALAPGALDHKTKQLVALGAALAAGCDP